VSICIIYQEPDVDVIQSDNTQIVVYSQIHLSFAYCQIHFDRKKPPPPGGFPIYYVPSSRTVCKRTPLEAPGTNPSRGVLLHTVLDEGT